MTFFEYPLPAHPETPNGTGIGDHYGALPLERARVVVVRDDAWHLETPEGLIE